MVAPWICTSVRTPDSPMCGGKRLKKLHEGVWKCLKCGARTVTPIKISEGT